MKYVVLFEGRKFESLVDGKRRLVGFFANRCVEAPEVTSIRIEGSADQLLEELKDQSIRPTPDSLITIENINEYESSHEEKVRGFTFYPDEPLFRRILNRLLRR